VTRSGHPGSERSLTDGTPGCSPGTPKSDGVRITTIQLRFACRCIVPRMVKRKHAVGSVQKVMRRGNPSRALLWGAGRQRFVIAVAILMLSPTAVPYAQLTERAPDTMEARLLACAACHGRQGEGT